MSEHDAEPLPPPVRGRRFATLLAAAAGVTATLALALFVVFAWLGLAAAPYGAVGASVVGGIVMRRALLRQPTPVQVVVFSAVCIGGALGGLWLADLLLS